MQHYEVVAVCLGNICRSPMAEAVLRGQLKKSGMDSLVAVDSAGTGSWHLGEPPDVRAMAALRRHGQDLSHRAKLIDASTIERSNLVLAMDRSNLDSLRMMIPDSVAVERIRLLRSFDPELMHLPEDEPSLDVPDPYYSEAADFDLALEMIVRACVGVVDHIRLDVYRDNNKFPGP